MAIRDNLQRAIDAAVAVVPQEGNDPFPERLAEINAVIANYASRLLAEFPAAVSGIDVTGNDRGTEARALITVFDNITAQP